MVRELVEEKYVNPLVPSDRLREFILEKADETEKVYTSWGTEAVKLRNLYDRVLYSVLYANKELLETVGRGNLLKDEPAWQLHSPVVGHDTFLDAEWSGLDSMGYMVKLEDIMWKELPGVGGCDQSGESIIIGFPFTYDRWLHVLLLCDDEEAGLRLYFPEGG